MSKPPEGYLPRPRQEGVVAGFVVGTLLDAVERLDGAPARAALDRSVGCADGAARAVPEAVAAALLRAVRRDLPALASEVQQLAGRETADALIATQLSARGRAMLGRAAWPIAAWLLGRWASQHSWTFAGSGRFRSPTRMELEIAGNPLVRGEVSDVPCCEFHAALFGQLFRRLVDPGLVCREMTCAATGAPACRFAVYLGSGPLSPAPAGEA